MESPAKLLILFGAGMILIGGGLPLAGRIPRLGRLPGDLLMQRKNFVLYVPLTTSLVLSLLGTLILWFVTRR